MNENVELLKVIYKDCSMSTYSLNALLKELESKENKIKKSIENILKGYERYKKDTEKLMTKQKADPKEENPMTKMMAHEGIKKEIRSDNSDANIADVLIKGITMGILDMEKLINNYEKDADKEIIKFSKEFLKFQKDNVEELKKHL